MINRTVLVGRLTNDVVLRRSQSGTSFASFTLAVNRRGKDDGADFISCIAFGKSAEFMHDYIKKGYLIGVEGRIQTRNYENQQGQKVYVTEVICDNVQNYQPKPTGSPSTPTEEKWTEATDNPFNITDADLPF